MGRDELQKMRDWADGKIAGRQEPPWVWFQYMKLRETLDALLAGMDCVTTESSLQSAEQSETYMRLVDPKDSQDSAQRRPVGLSTRLPT